MDREGPRLDSAIAHEPCAHALPLPSRPLALIVPTLAVHTHTHTTSLDIGNARPEGLGVL